MNYLKTVIKQSLRLLIPGEMNEHIATDYVEFSEFW
jgi:hypothetical protein